MSSLGGTGAFTVPGEIGSAFTCSTEGGFEQDSIGSLAVESLQLLSLSCLPCRLSGWTDVFRAVPTEDYLFL